MEMKTAEEVMKIIEQMDNKERWKLLNELYDEFYNKGDHPKTEIDFDY